MLYDALHRLVFPVVTSLVIATVWIVAWSSDLQAQADRKYWPALDVPAHSVKTTPSNSSLQQVLLKHN